MLGQPTERGEVLTVTDLQAVCHRFLLNFWKLQFFRVRLGSLQLRAWREHILIVRPLRAKEGTKPHTRLPSAPPATFLDFPPGGRYPDPVVVRLILVEASNGSATRPAHTGESPRVVRRKIRHRTGDSL